MCRTLRGSRGRESRSSGGSASSLGVGPRPSALPRTPRASFDASRDSRSLATPLSASRLPEPEPEPELVAAPSPAHLEASGLLDFLRHIISSERPLYGMNPGAVRAMLESIDRGRSGLIEASEFQHAMELGVGLSPAQIERLIGILSVSHRTIVAGVWARLGCAFHD